MSADIASVSYVLSSMASVGRILESIFNLSKRGITPTPEEFEKISTTTQMEVDREIAAGAFNQPDFARTMSDDVVNVIREEIIKIKQNITRVFKDHSMPEEQKSQALIKSRREYCFYIHQIRSFHGKTLPPDMEREWERLSCADFYFP